MRVTALAVNHTILTILSAAVNNTVLSVIVPTFRRPAMLRRCLQCLSNQRFDDGKYEVIVVDNAGDDETRAIVESLRPSTEIVVKLVVELRRGLHHARHAGAEVANGNLLLFTDDDILGPNLWLQEIVSAYRGEHVVAVGGPIAVEWDTPPPDWVREHEAVLGSLNHGTEWKLLQPSDFINGGNFSIRKSYLKAIGGFNPDQVKDVLIGDGETGLCKKIHARGDFIAWCPGPVVLHAQVSQKNGTLRDLRRRYANNGVCAAYEFAVKHDLDFLVLIKRLRHLIPAWSRCKANVTWRKIRSGLVDVDAWHRLSLHEAFLRAEITYLCRCLLDPRIKVVVRRRNWYEKA